MLCPELYVLSVTECLSFMCQWLLSRSRKSHGQRHFDINLFLQADLMQDWQPQRIKLHYMRLTPNLTDFQLHPTIQHKKLPTMPTRILPLHKGNK